jgi:hypothetical protein
MLPRRDFKTNADHSIVIEKGNKNKQKQDNSVVSNFLLFSLDLIKSNKIQTKNK